MGTRRKSRWREARQIDLSTFFRVSPDTIKAWAKRGMPGKSNAYELDEILAWLRREGPWVARQKPESDPLMDGPDTAGLERYRQAKAALAELELAERQGQLVQSEKVREKLLRWAVLIKRLGERLRKRYGPEAGKAFDATLEECRLVVDAEFGNSD